MATIISVGYEIQRHSVISAQYSSTNSKKWRIFGWEIMICKYEYQKQIFQVAGAILEAVHKSGRQSLANSLILVVF